MTIDGFPLRWNAIWRSGTHEPHAGPVHVSMNDFLIHKVADVPRVAREGMRFRHHWPETSGALGLWVGAVGTVRRQISVSVWRDPDDLKQFVRSPAHLRIMREFRGTGALYTNAWSSEHLDRAQIWREAVDRLRGRVDGVPHH